MLHVDEPAYIEPTKKQKQKFFEFLRQLKNYSFDLIIAGALNRTWLDNSLLSHFEATRQIVFGAPNVKPLSFSSCRDVVVVDEFCHETFKYQVLLKHLDSDREIHPPKLNIRPTDALAGSTILADLDLAKSLLLFACQPEHSIKKTKSGP
ncbi:hypothetical protein [Geotalea toluenoxydans]|uniref:hypothetical protein n=1 Tax=Geotalea toluenoxydans TaxID=421624 RepID=UPI0006CF39AD|nr:hypothetical protein [Geotalea toluenoxydans]